MDEKTFEGTLRKLGKVDVAIPPLVTQAIVNFEPSSSGKRGWRGTRRLVLVLACLLALGTMTVMATHVLRGFFGFESKGLDQAVAFSYVQNVEMEALPVGEGKSKLETVILDDYTLVLVFQHQLGQPVTGTIGEAELLLQQLSVVDEQGNVLLGEGMGMLARGYNSRLETDGTGTVTHALRIQAGIEPFPKSQSLTIAFAGITLSQKGTPALQLEGGWRYTLEVQESFVNREAIAYEMENPAQGMGEVLVANAEFAPTGFHLELHFTQPLDAMDLKLKLVDEAGTVTKSKTLSTENERTAPVIATTFDLSSFQPGESYQLQIVLPEQSFTLDLVKTE